MQVKAGEPQSVESYYIYLFIDLWAEKKEEKGEGGASNFAVELAFNGV